MLTWDGRRNTRISDGGVITFKCHGKLLTKILEHLENHRIKESPLEDVLGLANYALEVAEEKVQSSSICSARQINGVIHW